jgi:hypothetical protein
MKVTFDCSPEEARRLMGLPDLSEVHEAYVARLKAMVSDGMTPEMVAEMMKGWSSMGEASLQLWEQMLAGASARK